MATLTETAVRVVVELVRSPDSQSVWITAVSLDVDGNTLRVGEKTEVTSLLSSEQAAAAILLADACETYWKVRWQIL